MPSAVCEPWVALEEAGTGGKDRALFSLVEDDLYSGTDKKERRKKSHARRSSHMTRKND
jgi:rRNA processing protein Gar1